MALTTLKVQKCEAVPGEMLDAGPSPLAAETDKVYAATSDMHIPNDGKTLIIVDNQQAAATTAIGFNFPNKAFAGVPYGASGAGATVPAATVAVFGPFPTSLNNADGEIEMTVGTLTTVFVAAVSLG